MFYKRNYIFDCFFYACSLFFIGIYFLDWGFGVQHAIYDIVWLILSLTIFVFFIFYVIKYKQNLLKLNLSLVLILLFLLGIFGQGDKIKNYTLGKIVFHMESGDTPSHNIIKIRNINDNLTAYLSSSFFISTSYNRYDASFEGKQLRLSNAQLGEWIFHCEDMTCKSIKGERYSVYMDTLKLLIIDNSN